MVFVDASVLISYAFINDARHNEAKNLVEEMKKVDKLYISPIAIFEIHCVIPRRIIPIGGFKLPKPLQEVLNKFPQLEERLRESIEVVISYLRGELNPKLCSDEEISEIGQFNEVLVSGKPLKLLRLYMPGIQKSHKLRQRTLDMLQLTYVHEYGRKGFPTSFVTFDENIKNQAKIIKEELGIEIKG